MLLRRCALIVLTMYSGSTFQTFSSVLQRGRAVQDEVEKADRRPNRHDPTPQKLKCETDAKRFKSLLNIDYLTFAIIEFEEGFLHRSA